MSTTPDWRVLAPAPLQTVCVRHEPPGLTGEALDRHTQTWCDRINRSGAAYLTPALLDGRWMVRVSVGAEQTERAHVEQLWAAMQREVHDDPHHRRARRHGRRPCRARGPRRGRDASDLRRPRRRRPRVGHRGPRVPRLHRRHRRAEHRPSSPAGDRGDEAAARRLHAHLLPGGQLRRLRRTGGAAERAGRRRSEQDAAADHRRGGHRERGEDCRAATNRPASSRSTARSTAARCWGCR